ncbi:MAG: hypothetical protein HXX12_11800 [Geothrix sp.]|uniref:hypothetical protein n=1 Tax=Geothrix sp. TaxID=1962974 RepID=UPI0017969FD7|nr:hypothetical protein [Geothrix sp.]NWJ41638.1 hypothetical protein [Geothrix sp.]WIL20379.1 MAG: hypothetical protein QOZ81_002944 [Geothrix sp.]
MPEPTLSHTTQPQPPLQVWLGHLQKGWSQFRRHLGIGLAIGLLTGIVLLLLPNQYKSETRILPAEQRGGGGAGYAAAAMGLSIPGQESPDAVLVDILNSRTLREALLRSRFRFGIRSWYFGATETREQSLYDYLGKRNLDRAVKALQKRISVSRDIKTKLITISVETESPQLSQEVARQVVALLDEFVSSRARTRGGVKAAFSEKRLVEARDEMGRSEASFHAFLEGNRNYLLSSDPAVRLKGQRLENDFKLRTQVVTTLTIAHEQALIEEKNDMPILNVLDEGNLPIEKSGPPRSLAVGLAVALGISMSWAIANWAWISSKLNSNRGETV